ncbi:MAG: hypothetical protein JXK05_04270 [Campylobacterales bacterium]|nr:hypothetical protein [Campylobacterales bacterium]
MDTSHLPALPLSAPSAPDIPLHDIKPLLEVSDYSLYHFIGVVAAAVIVVAALLFWIWRRFVQSRKATARKIAYAALKAVDFSDPKAAAYAITRHGHLFEHDGERQREAFAHLCGLLEAYKYRPRVEMIDEQTRGYYENFVGMIDV